MLDVVCSPWAAIQWRGAPPGRDVMWPAVEEGAEGAGERQVIEVKDIVMWVDPVLKVASVASLSGRSLL